MDNLDQILPASRSLREGRVGCEDFNREVDLVGHALAGAVPAVEQFKVFFPVVRTDTVDVMDRLLGQEIAPDALLHNVPVFENVARRFPVSAGDDQSHVAVFRNALRDLLFRVIRLVPNSAKRTPTLRAAQPLLPVHSAARAPLHGHAHTALDAGYGPFFDRKTTPHTATSRRAVQGVFAELLSIFAKIRRLVAERFSANPATELDSVYLGRWPAVRGFVGGFARKAAKALVGVRRFNREGARALFANFLDRHFGFSMSGTRMDNTDVCLST